MDLVKAYRFAEQYRSGKTLSEIGAIEGVTRERIRQVLSSIGISGKDGGRAIKSISASAAKERAFCFRREQRLQRLFGCSYKEYCRISGQTLVRLYRHSNRLLQLWEMHRDKAIREHREWRFTLPEYAQLLNGREHLFKRQKDGLVLRLKDSTKGYSPENCEVTTLALSSFNGGGFKKAHKKLDQIAQKVKAFIDEGASQARAARKFGYSKGWVACLLSRARRLES